MKFFVNATNTLCRVFVFCIAYWPPSLSRQHHVNVDSQLSNSSMPIYGLLWMKIDSTDWPLFRARTHNHINPQYTVGSVWTPSVTNHDANMFVCGYFHWNFIWTKTYSFFIFLHWRTEFWKLIVAVKCNMIYANVKYRGSIWTPTVSKLFLSIFFSSYSKIPYLLAYKYKCNYVRHII